MIYTDVLVVSDFVSDLIVYLFKNGLGSQDTVVRIQCCLSIPRTSEIYSYQLPELVATFIL